MSDLPPQQPGPGEPSEEEVRAYLGQMRQAPAEQVLAEVLQGLLNAAQVKLGRNDARLLLDTAASVTDQTRAHLSGDLVQQVDQAIQQLRMAQVEAEQQVAESGQAEQNDLAGAPGATGQPSQAAESGPGDAPGATPPPQPGQPGQQSPLNKLWIPGR